MKKIRCKTNNGSYVEVNKKDLVFRPQIYAVIINKKNEILLCPNWDGYDFPGGGIEMGEKNEEALEREVFEETGLKIKIKKTFFIDSGFYFHPVKKKGFHNILIYATADVIGGEISTKNFDTCEKNYAGKAAWIPYKEIKEIKFYNSVDSIKLIEKAKKYE